jgi:type IV fimbrial biogenesis protein FimT
MKHNSGFTLIELLVTLSIVVILATVAVPNMQQFMTSNRLAGITTEYMGAFNLARSEAIKRALPVTICRSTDNINCNGTNWSGGMIAFVDTDSDRTRTVASEDLVKVFMPIDAPYAANAALVDTAGNTVNAIIFNRDGTVNGTGTFAFCYNASTTGAQAVILTRTRLRIATDSNADSIPNKENGNNIGTCAAP